MGVHRSFPGCDGARQCFTHVAEPFADTFLLGDVTEGFFEHPEYLAVRAPSWLLRSSATDAACLRRPSVVVVEPAQHREGHDAPAGLYAARLLPLVRDPLPDPLVRSPPVEVSHPFGEHAA